MDKHDRERQIKIFVSRDDHKRMRIAAALRGTTMSNFCRQVALNAARALTKNVRSLAGTATTAPDHQPPAGPESNGDQT